MALKEAYHRLVLYRLGKLPTGGFDERLVDLVQIAEGEQRILLVKKFPDDVQAADDWAIDVKTFVENSGDPNDYDLQLVVANIKEFRDI